MAYDATHREDEALGVKDGFFQYDWATTPLNFTCYKWGHDTLRRSSIRCSRSISDPIRVAA